MVKLRLLGPVDVVDDTGAAVRVGGPMERRVLAVLAVLAAGTGQVVSEDRLVAALWGDEPPSTARKSLQVYVSRIRKALVAHDDPSDELVIATHPAGYALQAAPGALDVGEMEALVAEARRAAQHGRAREAATLFARAAALWRGPSLDGMADEPWAVAEAQRLEMLRSSVVEAHAEARLALGEHREVAAELERVCREQPFAEGLWRLWMLALYRCGRQTEALRAGQRLRQHLLEEVGLDVAPETAALETAILTHDPALRGGPVRVRDVALPEGEVTFVLTDIEGSTRLWEADATLASVAVARHDELIAAVVSDHGGLLLRWRGEGDSTFAVFTDPAAAVGAAVDVQRAMAREPWPEGASILVRIGVHTGQAELRDGDYYGRVVNRAARLRAAGHGGQVLVSGVAAASAAGRLPEGVTLVHLGRHRLKDLAEPESIFQASHPELSSLPSSLAPIAVLDEGRHNLPVAPTALVGRDREVAEVTELVRGGARLVTITGAGGTGKTRLAAHAAGECADDFADGVWFVELSAIDRAELFPSVVCGVLGVVLGEGTGARMSELLTEHLRERRALLVIDNVEHVADVADDIARLLAACPRLQVLATSRGWLHLRGEHEYALEPLAPPAAARLFAERAAAAGHDVGAMDASVVDSICARLDNLPLAIELVAARARRADIAAIVNGLPVLEAAVGGFRDLPARQRALAAAIEWSERLLTDDARMLFHRLFPFWGGFTAEAVARVCGFPRLATIDLLEELADAALVQWDGTRGEMLSTIREYARSRLTPEDEHLLVDRFVAWAADVAATPADGSPEVPNVRAALSMAAAHSRVPDAGLRLAAAAGWLVRGGGYAEEAFALVERLLAAAPGAPPEERAAAHLAAADVCAWQGVGTRDAIAHAARGVELALEAGDAALEADGRWHLAYLLWSAGGMREADDAIDQARLGADAARRAGHTGLVISLTDFEARVAAAKGDEATAVAALAAAREAAGGDAALPGGGWATAGLVETARGNWSAARASFRLGIEVERTRSPRNWAVALIRAAEAAVEDGDVGDALALAAEAATLAESIEAAGAVFWAAVVASDAARASGAADEALGFARTAVAWARTPEQTAMGELFLAAASGESWRGAPGAEPEANDVLGVRRLQRALDAVRRRA